MTSPFDLRSILLARHAQHVALVHFPIALFITGTLFDFAARYTRRAPLATAAELNSTVAAIASVPVAITGVLAWQWQLEGTKLKGNLLLHLGLGAVSAVSICCFAWLRRKSRRTRNTMFLPGYLLAFEAVVSAVVALTAHVGGIVSGVTGAG